MLTRLIVTLIVVKACLVLTRGIVVHAYTAGLADSQEPTQ